MPTSWKKPLCTIKNISMAGMFAAVVTSAPWLGSQTAFAAPADRQQQFKQAAAEFSVPVNVLMAVSYNQSRWESHGSEQSVDGGYGLMNLTTQKPAEDSKGDGKVGSTAKPVQEYSLDKAAALLHTSIDQIKKDDVTNIRAGAAVLADYAKQSNGNSLPAITDSAAWYPAVAAYGGGATAQAFADDVYATMRNGQTATTLDGQQMNLPADANAKAAPERLGGRGGGNNTALPQGAKPAGNPECPAGLDCRFVPAAYAGTDPSNPAVYGNYDPAGRPKDMEITYIVIHDTEGSYNSAIKAFQDPAYGISTQYVIRSNDGQVTQMVKNSDVAFGAGDFYINMHGINIEHEGYAAQGATWYTEAMYRSSAKLVKYLSQKYDIPMDRQHIIGHEDVPTVTATRLAGQHYDPGPYWDWNHYMALVNGVSDAQYLNSLGATTTPAAGQTVAIAPNFKNYKQTFSDCGVDDTTCAALPKQSSSAVPIHTEPNATAPLLADTYLHPDGSAGTDRISDWGATVSAGHTYVVTGRQGDWTAISVGDKVGWFYDPRGAQQVSRSTSAPKATGKDNSALRVYGAAYPENSVYPAEVPAPTVDVLYTVPAGRSITASLNTLQTDYFYDATVDYSLPYDHVIFKGKTKYYQVQINHRIGYVKADDVAIR